MDATDWMQGGRDLARIGVIPTAANNPPNSGMNIVNNFINAYGVNATYINITTTSGNANDAALAALVGQMTGIFIVGGEQLRLTCTYTPGGVDTLVMAAVRQVLRNGGMVAGTSAGTGCQVQSPPIKTGRRFYFILPSIASGRI